MGSKVHTPPGAHTFGRAPSGQAVRIALLLWCEGPGWGGLGRSEVQAWLRVGLALELVPDSGMRRTLSSGWPSVRL